jgi:hypothetical protein
MSSPAAVLTDAYRVQQARIAGQTAAGMALAFRSLLDPANVDRTFAGYLAVAQTIVGGARADAAREAASYYYLHRDALGVPGPLPGMVSAADMAPEQLATGLLYAGPISIKQAMLRGRTLEEAAALALVLTLNTAYRYASDGGRFTIHDTAERDGLALGWARVTDGNPCYFCAMLASRGPVYKDERSALRRRDGRRYHNGCGCTVEPVYDHDQPWPGDARKYEELWKSSTAGRRGQDAINAFRRAHEGRQ